jgi:multiple sugar transport system substrate-binding protein
LYGTADKLYDGRSKKWIAPSQGMKDALGFLKTVYAEKLGPTQQQALDPHWADTIASKEMPKGTVAINLDGSWLPEGWIVDGAAEWPEWPTTLGTAAMPTQNGQAPGRVSLSGGFVLSVGANSKKPDAAFKLIQLAMNKENSLFYYVKAVQVSVRRDVTDEPDYLKINPTQRFWTSLVDVTQYRPAFSAYPKISNQIQAATEAVITGLSEPDKATKDLADQMKQIAGTDKVEGTP